MVTVSDGAIGRGPFAGFSKGTTSTAQEEAVEKHSRQHSSDLALRENVSEKKKPLQKKRRNRSTMKMDDSCREETTMASQDVADVEQGHHRDGSEELMVEVPSPEEEPNESPPSVTRKKAPGVVEKKGRKRRKSTKKGSPRSVPDFTEKTTNGESAQGDLEEGSNGRNRELATHEGTADSTEAAPREPLPTPTFKLERPLSFTQVEELTRPVSIARVHKRTIETRFKLFKEKRQEDELEPTTKSMNDLLDNSSGRRRGSKRGSPKKRKSRRDSKSAKQAEAAATFQADLQDDEKLSALADDLEEGVAIFQRSDDEASNASKSSFVFDGDKVCADTIEFKDIVVEVTSADALGSKVAIESNGNKPLVLNGALTRELEASKPTTIQPNRDVLLADSTSVSSHSNQEVKSGKEGKGQLGGRDMNQVLRRRMCYAPVLFVVVIIFSVVITILLLSKFGDRDVPFKR